jgi:hypothetical protein
LKRLIYMREVHFPTRGFMFCGRRAAVPNGRPNHVRPNADLTDGVID